MDPRVTTSMADLAQLFDLERLIAQALEDNTRALETLRSRKSVNPTTASLERALVRLDGGLAELLAGVDTGDVAPTAAARQALADFRKELDERIAEASALDR